MKYSGQTIIKKTEYKEEVVKAGQDNEEMVEGILHIIRGENED